ncbi:MAG TPA: hypothetical protein VLU96_03040 [Gaiellaceae bacterium]|nr:hypothetical protein [Gaiellaceae bacterium]
MQRSYGVVWRKGTGPLAAGKLELLPHGLRLEGLEGSSEVAYENLAGVRVGRTTDERIDGRPSVVLDRVHGDPVTIATVAQPSLVGEIAERLAALQLDASASRRLALVVPLKPDSHDAVRDLLAQGPPFDPEQIPGLDRHEVFLSRDEAVFVFDSGAGADALSPLLADPDFLKTAVSWRDHVAGPPRIAETIFAWTRVEEPESLSYLPTPGPGDSDGGDIF